jgi:hypothetical protein
MQKTLDGALERGLRYLKGSHRTLPAVGARTRLAFLACKVPIVRGGLRK